MASCAALVLILKGAPWDEAHCNGLLSTLLKTLQFKLNNPLRMKVNARRIIIINRLNDLIFMIIIIMY